MLLNAWEKFVHAPSGATADAAEATGSDAELDSALDSAIESEGSSADAGEATETHEDVEPPQPTFSQIRELAEKQGLHDLPDDPEKFVSSIAQLRQQAAAIQRERDAYAFHLQQQRIAAQQQQAPPQKREPPKAPWDVPKFDRKLLAQLTKDADGNIVSRPGAIPTIPQDYQAWQDAREAAIDQFLSDPYSILHGDATKELIREEAARVAQQMYEQTQSQSILENYRNQNADWLFDATGGLTPAGQRVHSAMLEAEQYGMNKGQAIAYAEAKLDQELYRLQLERQAAEGAAPKKQSPAEQRLAVLKKGAGHTGNRNGSTKTKTVAQNADPNKVWDRAREVAAQLPREDLMSN